MAVLLAADATTKEQAASLAAHQHLILQLSKDLGGRQWTKYDCEFREWAAAKNIGVWDDLNMAICGRCLPQLRHVTSPSESNRFSSGKSLIPACFKWNRGQCNRPLCNYLHWCSECGGPHRRSKCPFLCKIHCRASATAENNLGPNRNPKGNTLSINVHCSIPTHP